jgi:hypothetical protein
MSRSGYGKFSRGHSRHVPAHRESWKAHHGDIPAGAWVLHKCDTPACINPDHLFLGDVRINSADMAAKGRSQQGERHHNARLKLTDIERIRASTGVRAADLAAEFGVTANYISQIRAHTRWRHVT